ncbi:MAG: bifunctional nuclease domain-containing protein [Syntrophothermus sp.]|nr:bifunctional nuclease domain-containing protein [Ignavibacteriaceae bacterium]
MQKIQCEILGLSSGPSAGGAYAIVLKEVDGNRRLPIIIGAFEAQAIALEIEGVKPQRPLTHDLLKSVIDNLGASVVEVVIDELKENTFYAKILLEVSALTYEIDARPSDAIALAVRAQAPLFVVENVLDIAAFVPSDETYPEEGSETKNEKSEEKEPMPRTKEAQIASLQNKLREALEAEEYERAAKIRDDIKRLSTNN